LESKTPDLATMIEAAILRGATRAVIEAELLKQSTETKTPAPTAEEINAAYAIIVNGWIEDANQTEENAYAYHVRIRKHLYQKSFHLNDFKSCLAIADNLAKLEDKHRERQAKAAGSNRGGDAIGARLKAVL
jgi:hypothetical protein